MGRPRKNENAKTDTENLEEKADETPKDLTENPNEVDAKIEKAAVELTESAKVHPKIFKRNELGLVEGVNYEFCPETGLINWRKLVEKEFLVPNAVKFPDGTDLKDLDVEDLDDNQLLILLGGIKNLAQLRGYTKVEYKVHQANQNYVAVSCGITWVPNFETEGQLVYFEALADANFENTKSFAKDFLVATAENRAFTRAVRNFLRINVVGSDEMGDAKKSKGAVFSEEGPSKNPVSSYDPASVLAKLMESAKIPFEAVKKRLVDEGLADAEKWETVSDIPKQEVFKLIERIKEKLKEKKKD